MDTNPIQRTGSRSASCAPFESKTVVSYRCDDFACHAQIPSVASTRRNHLSPLRNSI